MEVILRRDVDKVGLRGEVVNVARGYARNFLLPRGLAEEATPSRVAELQKVEGRRAKHEAKTFEDAQVVADRLGQVELRFDVKAGPTGSLFGSVTPTDIADELWSQHKVRVDRRKIGVDTIKRIGREQAPIEEEPQPELDLDELDAAAAAQETELIAAGELQPSREDAEGELPEDEFDRAVDAGSEER